MEAENMDFRILDFAINTRTTSSPSSEKVSESSPGIPLAVEELSSVQFSPNCWAFTKSKSQGDIGSRRTCVCEYRKSRQTKK